MATTPNYSWVMPDPTDLVKDLPADFELFGDAVDATVDSIDDRVDVIEGQPVDIIPTGLSYYTRAFANVDTGEGNVTEDVTYYSPIFLPNCTLDRISCRTGNTTPVGTNTTRLGIYNSGANFLPSTVLLDAGTVAPAAADTDYEITISQAITKGLYWLAFNRQASGATPPNFREVEDASGIGLPFDDQIRETGTRMMGFSQTGVTGAFATATGLSILRSDAPVVWVRVA